MPIKKCGRKIIPQNRLSGKQTRVNTQYTPLSERQAIPKSEKDSLNQAPDKVR